MPKGKNYGSKSTGGGGTMTQQASGTPGMTPGGAGGTKATYSGQPTATGEKGSMGPGGTPNMLKCNDSETEYNPLGIK
ncbi:hypothetical protein N9980_01275 [bacterium]|nr:hypothetical protein [bacterium]